MQSALQRLLNKPCSFLLLKNLTRPSSTFDIASIDGACLHCHGACYRSSPRSTARAIHASYRSKLGHCDERHQSDSRSHISGSLPSPYQYNKSEAVEVNNRSLNSEELIFESDIGHEHHVGSRLVDRPEHRENFELWLQLLQFREQHKGDDGIRDIWKGITIRCRGLELPVTGPNADEIWERLLRPGFEDKTYLEGVYRYARWLWDEKGKRWPKFYSTILHEKLDNQRRHAWDWHVMLRDDFLLSSNDVRSVFPWNSPRFSGASSKGGYAFLRIYKDIKPKLYPDIVPKLCEKDMGEEAILWHDVFLKAQDFPLDLEDVTPLIRYLEGRGKRKLLNRIVDQLTASGAPLDPVAIANVISDEARREAILRIKLGEYDHSPEVKSEAETVPPDTSRTLKMESEKARREAIARIKLGDYVHSPQAKAQREGETCAERKGDEFCARLFATGFFGFPFVLSGLQMFKIKAIGPTSIRQIAINARSAEDVEDRFRQLKDAKIDIGHSAFVRLVQKLAKAKDEGLLQAVLESDQHPDVLEDSDLQEKLLWQYQCKNDWRNFHRTLAILTLDNDSEETVLNLQLRLECRNWDGNAISISAIPSVIGHMQEKKVRVTSRTLAWMYRCLTRWREHGQPEMLRHSHFDNLGYLITLWQGMFQAGIAQITAYHWKQVIRRLGMARRWDDLQALLLWLASWYAPIKSESAIDSVDSSPAELPVQAQMHCAPLLDSAAPFDKRQEFEKLIQPSLQRALVEWGFIHPYEPRPQDGHLSPLARQNASVPESSNSTQFSSHFYHPLVHWTRGLVLLQTLSRHGIKLNTPAIRQVCRHRLRYLYGELDVDVMNKAWSKLRIRATQADPALLMRFLVDAEMVWKGLFSKFPAEQAAGEDEWVRQLVNPGRSRNTEGKWEKRRRLIREGLHTPWRKHLSRKWVRWSVYRERGWRGWRPLKRQLSIRR